ncbi:DUF2189 domain-containing protein [Janthinobacterium sp. B9-8]|uniref:DUF2189 domain-containing protein n=1 Tax=Janthinobacterium sp. B9-8 TaxID=1236179 RepID=UPI00061D3787|nr:DUF2189 domain-containing protein [Janthinobacterium sp. B9-8]AMC36107.1 hypothetical protein VN23_16670 [Janthinobacterium sp. B9-8]
MSVHMAVLDQHFTLPKIRKVAANSPVLWLQKGWVDLWSHPGPSLVYGLLVTLVGALVLSLAINNPYLFTTSITGFLLLAPLGAAGIYELTSEREEGRPTSFVQSIRDLLANMGQLAFLGLALAMVAIAWERFSAILFAIFYGGQDVSLLGYLSSLTGEFLPFTIVWSLAGFLLAFFVFGLTAISIPMLADREVDSITAMMCSLRATSENRIVMVQWAALIVLLTAIGFVTVIGLIVIFPLLGHATWYAYKDLIE